MLSRLTIFCQRVGGTKISILREIKANNPKRFSWRLEVCFNINFKKVTWNIICKHLQLWHLRSSEPEKEPVSKCGHNHYLNRRCTICYWWKYKKNAQEITWPLGSRVTSFLERLFYIFRNNKYYMVGTTETGFPYNS